MKTLTGFINDPAVRYGIKYGLACCIAFYLSLLIRLDSPVWSVITVWVIMAARYVGAQAEKSVFRIIGTILGGLSGFVLTASPLQQEAVIFIPLVGLGVAAGTAWFYQSRAPYAGYLFSVTFIIVVADSIAQPENAWFVALSRMEEVFLGIIVSLVVSSVLWPEFARNDFNRHFSEALRTLQSSFREHVAIGLSGGTPQPRSYPLRAKFVALRGLLHHGSLESRTLRKHYDRYSSLVSMLARLYGSIELLEQGHVLHRAYLDGFGKELREMADSISSAIGALADRDIPAAHAALRRFGSLHDRVLVLLDGVASRPGIIEEVEMGEALNLSTFLACIHEASNNVQTICSGLDNIDEPVSAEEKSAATVRAPDPHWIKSGIRAGLVAMIGLVIQNWAHPPGAGSITVYSFLFVALSRTNMTGQGDRRVFHYLLFTVLGAVLYLPLLVAIGPMMADYYFLNTLIFASFFLYGYLTYGRVGMSMGMVLAAFGIIGAIGLNAQVPVDFQDCVNAALGIVLGVLLAAPVQRLIWPVLPQWEVRDRFVSWLDHCLALIRIRRRHTEPDARERSRLLSISLLPSALLSWIDQIHKTGTPPGETARLDRCVDALTQLSEHLFMGFREPDPLMASPELSHLARARESLIEEVHQLLTHCQRWVTGKEPTPISLEPAHAALERSRAEARIIRKSFAQKLPLQRRFTVYSQLHQHLMLGRSALAVAEAFQSLHPQLYMDDTIL